MISVRKILLPVLLLNITVSANLWEFFGIPLGPALYYLSILLICIVLFRTQYKVTALITGGIAFASKFIYILSEVMIFDILTKTCLAFLFILAGYILFFDRHSILNRQLIWLFAFSIPLMIMQKAGVSEWLLFWNTEVYHTNDVYDFDIEKDLGSLRYVAPVQQTLFVPSENLVYLITQGRPSGFLPGNNVLSIFLIIGFTLNLFSKPGNLRRVGDMVYCFALPLASSLLAIFGSVIAVFYLWRTKVPKADHKRFLVLAGTSLASFYLHALFFPGLSEQMFSVPKLVMSIGLRLREVAGLLSLDIVSAALAAQFSSIGVAADEGVNSSYSLLGIILRTDVSYIIALATALVALFYSRSVRRFRASGGRPEVFIGILLACVLSQLAVPFIKAPSFQLFLGLGLAPLIHMVSRNGNGCKPQS